MFHDGGVSKVYSPYLVAWGHNPKTVKPTFDEIEKVSRSVVGKKLLHHNFLCNILGGIKSTWPKW